MKKFWEKISVEGLLFNNEEGGLKGNEDINEVKLELGLDEMIEDSGSEEYELYSKVDSILSDIIEGIVVGLLFIL